MSASLATRRTPLSYRWWLMSSLGANGCDLVKIRRRNDVRYLDSQFFLIYHVPAKLVPKMFPHFFLKFSHRVVPLK